MEFTERQHAFISASFYKLLSEAAFPGYKEAFLYAARRYAEQRGGRMAQRAIRDGRPLDFASYRYYKEWAHSDAAKAEGFGSPSDTTVESEGSDLVFCFRSCPWSSQYLDMGLLEGAELYCSDLDRSIVRGFNPELCFELRQTMHRDGSCIQVMKDAGSPDSVQAPDPKNIKDLAYHCGHIYRCFSDVMTAIYGDKGTQLSEDVMASFASEYGDAAAKELKAQSAQDFNYIG